MRATPIGFVVALAVLPVLSGCACSSYSASQFVGVPAPTYMSTPKNVDSELKSEVNSPLSWYARLFGAVTTPFKRLGVFGWTDMKFVAAATGTVEQVSESSDRFLTVDLRLDSFMVNSSPVPLTIPKFIRAEICLADIPLAEFQKPTVNQRIRIAGRLMWDGDGFLEIHPRSTNDVVIVGSRIGRDD